MDIKTIKEMKQQCESEIKAILVMFEKQSGLSVESVDLSLGHHINGDTELINVSMDVNIK